MMTEGLDVKLLAGKAHKVLPADEDHVMLMTKSGGLSFLNEQQPYMESLLQALTMRVKDCGRQFFVRADKNVPYGQMMEVMDQA
ncbi:MAG: hypothetical protein F8N36_05575 [Desulfovibrio sp.]|uniref:ExbD/TolR family protein n=1 Tax=Desulfovibrio sp. TaxID=885 RepID=UPI00135D22A4|nr:hypothetical protein [Desulfovibrio sp.]MTJ92317.1 hypothetical protein [Desulfovibrio sp.]